MRTREQPHAERGNAVIFDTIPQMMAYARDDKQRYANAARRMAASSQPAQRSRDTRE